MDASGTWYICAQCIVYTVTPSPCSLFHNRSGREEVTVPIVFRETPSPKNSWFTQSLGLHTCSFLHGQTIMYSFSSPTSSHFPSPSINHLRTHISKEANECYAKIDVRKGYSEECQILYYRGHQSLPSVNHFKTGGATRRVLASHSRISLHSYLQHLHSINVPATMDSKIKCKLTRSMWDVTCAADSGRMKVCYC